MDIVIVEKAGNLVLCHAQLFDGIDGAIGTAHVQQNLHG
jgi:hypothetical protein